VERFKRFGNVGNVERAVSVLEYAVQLTPDDDPAKPGRLNNLGNSFSLRSQTPLGRVGDVADIDRAISSFRNAAQLTSDNHGKVIHLTNLGKSYFLRFERLWRHWRH
jgi:hypothetical protein